MTEIEKIGKAIDHCEGSIGIMDSYQIDYDEAPTPRIVVETALTALREKSERERPEALTWDELRGMVGKPIFLKALEDEFEDESFWAGIRSVSDDEVAFDNGEVGDRTVYNKRWLAYAHRP